MDILQLQYFCDAAVSENFSATARKFKVPPSDISQSIRRLENELNVSLFSRTANKIALNSCGEAFYKEVSEALARIEKASSAVRDDGGGNMNILVNTNRQLVMSTVKKFKMQYPDVTIKTKFSSDPKTDDYDLVISDEDDRIKGYDSKPLLSERLAVALSIKSSLADKDRISADELSKEPFITMNEGSGLYKLTMTICKELGFKPRIAVQSDDPFYIRKCVEFGLGVSLVPTFSWKGQFSEGIKLKDIGNYTRDTFIFKDSKKYTPVCVRRFEELLFEEYMAQKENELTK